MLTEEADPLTTFQNGRTYHGFRDGAYLMVSLLAVPVIYILYTKLKGNLNCTAKRRIRTGPS